MNLPLQIFRKDLRRYWPLAAFAAAFIMVETLSPLWGIPLKWEQFDGRVSLLDLAKWPVIFILVVAVMQEDLTVGDKAFWRTRPIAAGSLLAGKLLFLTLVLALPAVLANVWIATALDTSATVSLGIMVETTGVMLLAVLASALIAALTGNLLHAAFAALGGIVVVALFGLAREALSPGLVIRLPWDTDISYPGARMAFACVLACAALLAVLAHQYFTRRSGRTVALLALAVPLVLATAATWTRDFVEPSRAAAYPAKPLQRTEGIAINMETPAQAMGTHWSYDGATRRRHLEVNVMLFADLIGAPPGRLFELLSATSTLRLNDGREMKFMSVGQSGYANPWRNAEGGAAICRALGLELPPAQDPRGVQAGVQIFSLPKTELAALAGARGRLTTTLALGERAFRELFRLPAHTGAARREPGQVWRLDKVGRPDDDDAAIVIEHLRATTMLAPRGEARADILSSPFTDIFYVLVNRQRGEYSEARWDWTHPEAGIVSSSRIMLRFRESYRAGKKVPDVQIDNAWLANAELVFFHTEALGRTEKTVVVEDFEVPRPN